VAADSKAKLLDDAEKYVLHGKIRLAIAEYLKVINLDPDDVLIINTVGDLYLRQGNWQEANKLFLQVAEKYVHNNFLLKAIAVYKKILNSDSDNIVVNTTMAALYVKQGLNLNACNQYMRVIELLEKEGKAGETLGFYEKIVELDPWNSTVQRKLADLYENAGAGKKAHVCWIGAARAQVKSGDSAGASNSYLHALNISSLDIDSLRGLVDCCQKTANLDAALKQLQKSLDLAPQNPDILEMLGRVYLGIGDCEPASKAFQMALSMDESRYGNFFELAQTLIDKEAYDQAAGCLDAIIPIIITKRDTDRAVKQYRLILQRRPKHLLALIKLASVYSAIGDQAQYSDVCDELAEYYMADNRPIEALEYIEKILQLDPENAKHLKLHRQTFIAGYPDAPYVSPLTPSESPNIATPLHKEREFSGTGEESLSETILEVDLLLNYGLKDKALSILLNLEATDPYDKETRIRLSSVYKAEGKNVEAAEQCLLLAALYRTGNNEDAARSYLSKAKQLAPGLDADHINLIEYARNHGLLFAMPDSSYSSSSGTRSSMPSSNAAIEFGSEVDLSSDLMNSFFKEKPGGMGKGHEESSEITDRMTEGYPQTMPSAAPVKSLDEQFQEVDFYIRLGFNDEALVKLSEIARIDPNNPELALRYEKLGQLKDENAEIASIVLDDSDKDLDLLKNEDLEEINIDSPQPDASDAQEELNDFLKDFGEVSSPSLNFDLQPETLFDSLPDVTDSDVDDIFADLMHEDGPAMEESEESFFEEHFNLGTAYREMDLLEDAIKEFEFAFNGIKKPEGNPRAVQCCGMLSTCFLKKNVPDSVLYWCQVGLSLTEVSSHEAMALHYDMGLAYIMNGSNERALACYREIFSQDHDYRDVAHKIEELQGGLQRRVP
jgi:tetratricopeptide (TPR) repeat protein